MYWIYCHPLFEERKVAHRFSYLLEQAFYEKGLRLRRFDYRGCGDDAGCFSEVTLERLREDLCQQIVSISPCGLIGLRLGATLALEYVIKQADIEKLILIEPILNGRDYVDHLLRKQRIKDLYTVEKSYIDQRDNYINLEGFKTHDHFVDQLQQIRFTQKDFPKESIVLNQLPAFWESFSPAAVKSIIEDIMQHVHN